MPDLVSVIIPTYNRAHCVAHAITSALRQTHAAVEVLVVDDGSRDGTQRLLAERFGGDRRVRVIGQDNAGVAAARNTGLAAAAGDYLAFLDSDDWWYPWKLEAQLAALDAFPEAGMVWSDMEAVDPAGTLVAPRYLRHYYGAYRWFPTQRELFAHTRAVGGHRVHAGDIFSAMVTGNLVHTSTVLLRRDRLQLVGGFDTALAPAGEDYDFHLRTCREGPVAFVDTATIRYQTGTGDRLTAHRRAMAANFLAILTRTLERDRARIDLPAAMLRAIQADAHRWLGEVNAEEGRFGDGRRHYLRSLAYRPWQPRTAAMLALCTLPAGATEILRRIWRWMRTAVPPLPRQSRGR
jgi:glycosyltransferase involved in cell wall biosynthesis